MPEPSTAERIYNLFRDIRRQNEALAAAEDARDIVASNPDVAEFNRRAPAITTRVKDVLVAMIGEMVAGDAGRAKGGASMAGEPSEDEDLVSDIGRFIDHVDCVAYDCKDIDSGKLLEARSALDALASRLAEAGRRLREAEGERDAIATVLRDAGGHLDYLRELWGDEAITRNVADRIRGALAGLAPGVGPGEGREGGTR